jgi:2-polyprenyl-6-methoxyphenol hydroxylase-like FAD-dependent oxidoreductase
MDSDTESRLLREISRYVSIHQGVSREYVALRNLQGNTLLHSAVSSGNADLVLACLLSGADVSATNNDGHSPLDVAVEKRNRVIGKLLLGAGGRLESVPGDWLELCRLTHASASVFSSLPNYFEPWWRRQGNEFRYPDQPLSVSVIGAGPSGLVVACNLVEWLGPRLVRVNVYDTRIGPGFDGIFVSTARVRRDQVVTLQMDVLESLSYRTRCSLFQHVDEAVWGQSTRNIPIREVEDRLLELAQTAPYNECITLHSSPRSSSVSEHRAFLKEVIIKDNPTVVIGADGAGSMTRDVFDIERVEIPENQARSDFVLAVALRVREGEFATGLPLSQHCNVIMTLFQHRFLLNASSVERSGYLNILLSRDEWTYMQLCGAFRGARQRCDWGHQGHVYPGDDVNAHDDEFYPSYQHKRGIPGPEADLWQTVLDGLTFFGLNVSHIENIVGITINVFHSEKYVKDLVTISSLVNDLNMLVLLLSDESVTAKENSARALGNLASGSDDRRSAIVDAGAVPALVMLLSDGSMTAKEQSARALSNLAAGSDDRCRAIIVDAGAVPSLVLLLSDGSVTAKENSARALGNLASGSDDRRSAIVDARAVPALVLLLSDESVTAKEHIGRALSNLAAGSDDPPVLVGEIPHSVIGCLVGDAAFPTHFWPGRGMNSAIKEAAVLAFCLASHHCEKRARGITAVDRELVSYSSFVQSSQQREHPMRSLLFTCDRRLVGLIEEADGDNDTRKVIFQDLELRKNTVQERLSRAWGWPEEECVSALMFREILDRLSLRQLKILRKVGPWPVAPGDEVLAIQKIWEVNQRGETPVV